MASRTPDAVQLAVLGVGRVAIAAAIIHLVKGGRLA